MRNIEYTYYVDDPVWTPFSVLNLPVTTGKKA